MKRILLTIAFLLTMSHTAWAGPEMMLAVLRTCKPQTGTVSTLNGETLIDSGFLDDTGPDTPSALSLCSGTASITASCYGGTGGGYAQVFLRINGTVVQTLNCGATVTQTNVTLSWPVSGRYTAEVFGVSSGGGTFAAAGFSFPVAQ